MVVGCIEARARMCVEKGIKKTRKRTRKATRSAVHCPLARKKRRKEERKKESISPFHPFESSQKSPVQSIRPEKRLIRMPCHAREREVPIFYSSSCRPVIFFLSFPLSPSPLLTLFLFPRATKASSSSPSYWSRLFLPCQE